MEVILSGSFYLWKTVSSHPWSKWTHCNILLMDIITIKSKIYNKAFARSMVTWPLSVVICFSGTTYGQTHLVTWVAVVWGWLMGWIRPTDLPGPHQPACWIQCLLQDSHHPWCLLQLVCDLHCTYAKTGAACNVGPGAGASFKTDPRWFGADTAGGTRPRSCTWG